MNKKDKKLIEKIIKENSYKVTARNYRKNGETVEKIISENINIISKTDSSGIDVYIKANSKDEVISIPVIITESGLKDVVYNTFYIGENADVTILAGCGICVTCNEDTGHDGIHTFILEKNAKVKYIENHYGSGAGVGKKTLNPQTKIIMAPYSNMEIETIQIKGIDDTYRTTETSLDKNTTLIIKEKILTNSNQKAKTVFKANLNKENSSIHIVSRSVATENSYQEFESNLEGECQCYGHVECDAIIKDNAIVKATPKIFAKNIEANLVHEAYIGKIAGDQLKKLMSLGLDEKEAENVIISGFLK